MFVFLGLLAVVIISISWRVWKAANENPADVVKSDRTDILYGQDYFYEELLGLRFKISTFSFFQTNSLGAEVLYETAREFILSDDADKLKDKVVS